ncbi:MAG: AI-2E family transporter [Acidobacteria bacterium]|nr:AI-2E family transporter [Acidobacteriota bacterium]
MAAGIEINRRRRATIIFLVVLSAVTLWFCYLIAKPFLNPIFFAVVLAIVFYPLHSRLHRWIRNANGAAILSTLCVLLAIVVPAFLLGAALRKELTDIYQSLNAMNAVNGGFIHNVLQYVEKSRIWLGQYVDLSQVDLRAELVGRLQQLSSFLLSQFAGLAGGITSFVVALVITFFTLFYLFRDGRAVWRRMAALIPLSANRLEKLTTGVSRTITASMYGGLAVAIVQGLLTGMAIWILGLPSPVLWGMTAAIFSFVPIIGTSIVWLPASIVLMLSGHLVKGLILLGWGAVIVGLSDNIIRPLVISGQTRFHPLYVFFALLGGIQAFGIIGLFVGPVVLAVAQELFGLIREEMRPQEVEEEPALTDP